MATITEFVSETQIKERVKSLAREIEKDYEGKAIRLICVLNGSVPFSKDLLMELEVPVSLDFIKISSYGKEIESNGKPEVKRELDFPIKGENVIVIEDIVDSGHTLQVMKKVLEEREPQSLKFCTFIDRPKFRKVDFKPDYVGFEVDTKDFLVGYGMDCKEQHRELPYIATITFE